MDEKEKRDQVQGSLLTDSLDSDHVPDRVAVYDRPERKMPSLWQIVILAVLFLAAAVIAYQLIF